MSENLVARDHLVAELIEQDIEFRSLFKQHQELEAQLEEFGRRKYLNTDESMERKRIQKVKLQGKDRMEELLRRYAERTAVAA